MTNMCHIGLGSNMGDRFAYLQQGLNKIAARPSIKVINVSSVFESDAHVKPGSAPQSGYLNAVVKVQTTMTPDALLAACLSIELSCGRDRSTDEKWKPRTLDLDLLLLGDTNMDTPHLQLPHPRLADRRFVLGPLAEIDPELKLPAPFHHDVRYLLERCPDNNPIVRTAHQLVVAPEALHAE